MLQDVADGFLQKALVLGLVLRVAGLQAEFLVFSIVKIIVVSSSPYYQR